MLTYAAIIVLFGLQEGLASTHALRVKELGDFVTEVSLPATQTHAAALFYAAEGVDSLRLKRNCIHDV